MASFVHIADARDASKILRNGVRASADRRGGRGVFCVPLLPSFQATFQWVRELKRRGFRTACAVQIRLNDTEIVQVARYGQSFTAMTAAEAVAHFLSRVDGRGQEVVVPRSIARREIVRVRSIPQLTGWRYNPEAKHSEPLWPFRGERNAARLRRALERRNQGLLE
jgi:hypothetical protein